MSKKKNMKANAILALIAVLAAGLSGCMVGPDFETPEADMPEKWSNEADAKSITDIGVPRKMTPEELATWWEIFDDPVLTSLIKRSFEGNLSIRIAAERIAQARATLGVTQSGFFPSVDVNAGMSENGHPIDVTSTSYRMGATAAWEIDVFGGVRRGIESAAADYNAAIANKAAARISVAAEVAQNYFTYRCVQHEILITRSNLETQKGTYRATLARQKSGFVSKLDTVRAAAQVDSTSAQLPVLERELKLTRHALEYLLGLKTGALEKELSDVGPLPALEKYIPISVPAELLERRPDIIAAEYKLHAATAKIGNARADYYPKFSITGNISYEAPKIGNIVQNQYGSWSVGPNVSWNIFQAGKTVYNVKLQEALTREAGVNWEDAVLTAIKEVEDALVSAEKERARIEHLNRMVENYRKAFELSRELYTQGEIEFIDLLEAQRSMLSSAQNQVLSRKDFIGYIIMLYKSLGGGWTEADVADEPENLEWIFFDSLGDNPERTAAAEK